MDRFFITFAVNRPFGQCYVEVYAPDYGTVADVAFEMFKERWAFIYAEDQFKKQPDQFKLKRLCSIRRNEHGHYRVFEIGGETTF